MIDVNKVLHEKIIQLQNQLEFERLRTAIVQQDYNNRAKAEMATLQIESEREILRLKAEIAKLKNFSEFSP